MKIFTEKQREQYVQEVVSYGKNNGVSVTEMGARALVHAWESSAFKMFNAMGNKLRVSMLTESTPTDEEVYRIVDNNVDIFLYSFTHDYTPFMSGDMSILNRKTRALLRAMVSYKPIRDCVVTGVISEEMFSANHTPLQVVDILKASGVTVGMKMSKAFIKVMDYDIKSFNAETEYIPSQFSTPEEYAEHVKEQRTLLKDKMSQQFSVLIQECKNLTKKVEVFLSNDLMDWIKMSDMATTTSCHTWENGGGLFAQGTISYALQPDMLIGYTRNANGKIQWRQVVYTDLESGHAIGSRQYPGLNDNCATAVRNLWQQVSFGSSEGFKFKQRLSHNYDYFSDFLDTENYQTDSEFGYVDLLHGAGTSSSAWQTWRPENGKPVLAVNNDFIVCVDCGDQSYEREESSVVCGSCNGSKYYCEQCEGMHHEDGVRYTNSVNGYVCDDCLNDHFTWCEHCEEYVHGDDAEYLHGVDMYICDDCRVNHYVCCDNCNDYHHIDDNRYVEGHNGSCDIDVCSTCYEDMSNDGYIFTCEGCGYECHDHHGNTSGYCVDCEPEEETEEETEDVQPTPVACTFDIEPGMAFKVIDDSNLECKAKGCVGRVVRVINGKCLVSFKAKNGRYVVRMVPQSDMFDTFTFNFVGMEDVRQNITGARSIRKGMMCKVISQGVLASSSYIGHYAYVQEVTRYNNIVINVYGISQTVPLSQVGATLDFNY